MKDIAQWTAPSPLWAAAADDTGDPRRTLFRQPAILRFASDSFMDDFMALLESDPTQLVEYIAQPETWRGPQKTPAQPAPLTGFELRVERLRLAAERRALGSALPVSAGTQALAEAKKKRAESQLKLYQPAHQRFYLIAACCVCRVAGLPDKAIDAGRAERVTFVLRRLIEKPTNPNAPGEAKEFDEYGFVATPQAHVWKKVKVDQTGAPLGLVKGEEQLPLFTVNFIESDSYKRRLLGGIIPVGRREAYMGAPLSSGNGSESPEPNSNGATKKTARKILFRTVVTEPWKTLITRAEDTRKRIAGGAASAADTNPDLPMNDGSAQGIAAVNGFLKATREQLQTVSWLVLLDFADYLRQYLPDVWTSIKTGINVGSLTRPQLDLLSALEHTVVDSSLRNALLFAQSVYAAGDVALNLRDALRRMIAFDGEKPGDKRSLEIVADSYDRSKPNPLWPRFLFPLADPGAAVIAPQIPAPPAGVTLPQDESSIAQGTALDNIDLLVGYLVKALPADSSALEPPPPLAATRPFVEREGLFAIRCVYERPECGPLELAVLSEPTNLFQMAGFFDPDAPARPIRIALPVDTSPAGLRKHDKNTAFMISDVLCGQIGRFKSLSLGDLVRSVLPWPFHKDLDMSAPDQGACKTSGGVEFGMICSLSIPIITICALILLMVIVFLFDLIFKWIPFFIMCFPLPKFKAKPS